MLRVLSSIIDAIQLRNSGLRESVILSASENDGDGGSFLLHLVRGFLGGTTHGPMGSRAERRRQIIVV